MRNTLLRPVFFIFLFFTAFVPAAFAQLNHFIYLQTDNQQPFYIKYNNRIYSSSSMGYLILSKLKDGPLEFSLGFPKSDQPEQKFQCVVDKADKGYLIKNFSDKGWGLFDLQNSGVVYANTPPATNSNVTSHTNQPPANDAFSNMLSKVTQDSTVKNVTVKKEEPKVVVNEVKPAVETKTEPAVQQSPVKEPAQATETVVQQQQPVTEPEWTKPAKSAIMQLRKFESKEGSDFVYEVQEGSGSRDTVRLFIEKEELANAPVTQSPIPTPTPVVDTTPVVQQQVITPVQQPQQTEVKREEKPQETVKTESKPEVAKTETQPVKEEIKTTTSLPNTNCKSVAGEDDFIKLRRKMANASKDETMINEAKKVFKTKCFTTAQVKNLAVLFLNDEGRYRFYDAAMPYVSDFGNFKSLSETIQDDYYKKRFFALLPNQ